MEITQQKLWQLENLQQLNQVMKLENNLVSDKLWSRNLGSASALITSNLSDQTTFFSREVRNDGKFHAN